ncbi:hypothetical protein M3J09_006408 [Ascochyta lentis]
MSRRSASLYPYLRTEHQRSCAKQVTGLNKHLGPPASFGPDIHSAVCSFQEIESSGGTLEAYIFLLN